MFGFLAENAGTIVISAILVVIVAAVIVSLFKGKKKGKCSCGGNCGSCGMNCSCHRK